MVRNSTFFFRIDFRKVRFYSRARNVESYSRKCHHRMVTVIKPGWIKIFSLSYRRYGLGLDRDNFKSITEFNISWTKSRVGYRIESGIIRSKKTQRLMTVASLKLSTPLRSLKSIFDQTSQIFDAENYHFHSSLSPKIKRFSRKKL